MERKRIFRRKLYKNPNQTLPLSLSILYEPLQIRRWCVVRCKLPCISSAILNMFTLILNSWLILCWKLWCGGRLPPRSSLVYTQLWYLGFCLQKNYNIISKESVSNASCCFFLHESHSSALALSVSLFHYCLLLLHVPDWTLQCVCVCVFRAINNNKRKSCKHPQRTQTGWLKYIDLFRNKNNNIFYYK